MTVREFALEDRYLAEHDTVVLSGIHALIRVPLDQHRADTARGLRTGTLISGYRGSPIGGLDLTLESNPRLLADHDIVFISGLNEDLGATAVMGSQLANMMDDKIYDGVLGMWYGKAPGVDRSGDALKHANYAGVGHNGGVLAVAGDDPADKSSTLPSQSEYALLDAQLPILYPGNVQEVLDLGRYGFELSRYSGLWTGFKIVTNVADEYSTAEVSPDRITLVDPGFMYRGRPWRHTQDDRLIAPFALEAEREIHEGRVVAAREFGRAHELNRISLRTEQAWLGIAAAGKTYYDVREAMLRLGLDDARLSRYGIRLLKINMPWPMDRALIQEFGRGLEKILVVEEKRPFVEHALKEALYDLAERPVVVGKQDERGEVLVPGYGELDADMILEFLPGVLSERIPAGEMGVTPKVKISLEVALDKASSAPADLVRTPYFCSGCPHNRSTVVPEGSVAGGGIGCHGMALLIPNRNVTGITQMGAEGIQWVGAAPFVAENHRFQNLGDGTFFHSGSLAVRAAVAAGTNITYKILYNGAVAMTGGQDAAGEMPVPQLSRWLESEGVARTIICTDDPGKYPKGADFAANAEVWDRDLLDEAQRELRDIPGVTALVYDQPCAADLRRKRRRGQVLDPNLRVFINEDVCEGCGDCGEASNCLSVQPVDTELGRKTQIHQASCNKDYSCLDGNCPAFVTVIPEAGAAQAPLLEIDPIGDDLPGPVRPRLEEGNVYLMGIGGTGVVTINQLLATAALIDGKFAASLDQTGLSQKGGPVVSNLKVTLEPAAASNKVGNGEADAYVVFDLLSGTTQKNLAKATGERTCAIVSSSEIPTGAMVSDNSVDYPEFDALRRRVDAASRAGENVYFDAEQISRNLFRTHMPANLIVIGAAWQSGVIPVSAEAIEKAVELNGVSVEMNVQAFRVGRKIVAEPGFVDTLYVDNTVGTGSAPVVTAKARRMIGKVGASGELLRLLEYRVPELIDYQNVGYARDYVEFVSRVHERERTVMGDTTTLAETVARHLYKLMAYKDEYEVARLHLKSGFGEALARQFGETAKVTYQLHPPMMKAMGLDRKIPLGSWVDPVFKGLATGRRLRGTPADPFGRTEERRTERALIGEYRDLVATALASLSPESHPAAVELAATPDIIRGYDTVKAASIQRWRAKVDELRG